MVQSPNSPLVKSLQKGDTGQAAVTAVFVLSSLDNGETTAQEKNQVSGIK